MWFKNLCLYRFTRPFEVSAEVLEQQLAAQAFAPCGSQDAECSGWVAPLGPKASQLVHVSGGYMMVCLRRQDKLLPATVVREELEQRVEAIEEAEARKVGRKEKTQLRDDVIFSLMPRAFVRSTRHFAYIDSRAGLLVVNAASANRAEELLNALREAVGTLPVVPLRARAQPQQLMTDWLLQARPPAGFSFGHECELRDPGERGSVVRCKNQDLSADEINNHMKTGMTVTRLGLCWQGGVEFLVDDALTVRRVTFDDGITEQAEQHDGVDAAAQFDIDFSIMTLTLTRFIDELMAAFGGEDLTALERDAA